MDNIQYNNAITYNSLLCFVQSFVKLMPESLCSIVADPSGLLCQSGTWLLMALFCTMHTEIFLPEIPLHLLIAHKHHVSYGGEMLKSLHYHIIVHVICFFWLDILYLFDEVKQIFFCDDLKSLPKQMQLGRV